MLTKTTRTTPTLASVHRGVREPDAVAAFFAWLLGQEPTKAGDEFHFFLENGELVIHHDISVPIAIGLALEPGQSLDDKDPDGVPLRVAREPGAGRASRTRLDHAALMCADVVASAKFYTSFGFQVTWSEAKGGLITDGAQRVPDEADWLHLSGTDGYLSLSQADWKDYGRHNDAAGPPRFVHLGLAVPSLDDVLSRIEAARTPFLTGSPAVGRNLYLNDPDGDPSRGSNVEIIEYVPGVSRSGLRHAN